MTFQRAVPPVEGVLVIVPGRGLVIPAATVTLDDLREIANVGVAADNPRFQEPLRRDATRLSEFLEDTDQVVLLGSIATDKYVGTLQACLDRRLRYPRTVRDENGQLPSVDLPVALLGAQGDALPVGAGPHDVHASK